MSVHVTDETTPSLYTATADVVYTTGQANFAYDTWGILTGQRNFTYATLLTVLNIGRGFIYDARRLLLVIRLFVYDTAPPRYTRLFTYDARLYDGAIRQFTYDTHGVLSAIRNFIYDTHGIFKYTRRFVYDVGGALTSIRNLIFDTRDSKKLPVEGEGTDPNVRA